MKRFKTIFSRRLANVALLLSCAACGANAGELSRNPFLPPADFNVVSAGNGASSVRQQNLEMRVSGILVAGDQALVSIAGQILAPGEEVNGYLLVEVTADRAVFQRGEELLTLNLYPEDNDEPKVP